MVARSKRYIESKKRFDGNKEYSIKEAVDILKGFPPAKFDQSVELSFKLGIDPKRSDQMLRDAFSLPKGVGKSRRVVVFTTGERAEKALKAVFQRYSADAWGHLLADLMEALPAEVTAPPGLMQRAKELDKHYITPRYPNALAHGAPGQSYTRGEAERAIENADRILRFCEDHIL